MGGGRDWGEEEGKGMERREKERLEERELRLVAGAF